MANLINSGPGRKNSFGIPSEDNTQSGDEMDTMDLLRDPEPEEVEEEVSTQFGEIDYDSVEYDDEDEEPQEEEEEEEPDPLEVIQTLKQSAESDDSEVDRLRRNVSVLETQLNTFKEMMGERIRGDETRKVDSEEDDEIDYSSAPIAQTFEKLTREHPERLGVAINEIVQRELKRYREKEVEPIKAKLEENERRTQVSQTLQQTQQTLQEGLAKAYELGDRWEKAVIEDLGQNKKTSVLYGFLKDNPEFGQSVKGIVAGVREVASDLRGKATPRDSENTQEAARTTNTMRAAQSNSTPSKSNRLPREQKKKLSAEEAIAQRISKDKSPRQKLGGVFA